jgi:hypothetical protein
MQQRVSKTLDPAQRKCSAYDQKLLTIHEVLKHFLHMLKVRHFITSRP